MTANDATKPSSHAPPPDDLRSRRRLPLKLAKIAGWVLLACALVVVAYKLAYPTYTHRFRITIEVDTPEGVKTGSGVYEVEASKQPQVFGSIPPYYTVLKGDAVLVNLGASRNLVALRRLGPPSLSSGAGLDSLALLAFGMLIDFQNFRTLSNMSGSVELPVKLWPVLVTFGDLTNPGSLELVAPEQITEIFGTAVQVRAISLRLTNDPPTRGIEERMPWLSDPRLWVAGNERLRKFGFSRGAIHEYLKGAF